MVLDYLRIGVVTVYIRGNERAGECEWYTQITFSGCAGMAEVSAEVCAHWTEAWFADEFESELRPLLREYGFEAQAEFSIEESGFRFASVSAEGAETYARLYDTGEVELDAAVYEGLTEDYEKFLERLRNQCRDQAASGRCYCQISMGE